MVLVRLFLQERLLKFRHRLQSLLGRDGCFDPGKLRELNAVEEVLVEQYPAFLNCYRGCPEARFQWWQTEKLYNQ
jgi:hypothetical protein